MSYDSLENANSGSTAILLFMFKRGNVVWRYCNQDEDIVADGKLWTGLDTPIIMDGNKQTGDPTQDAVNFTVPSNIPIATLFTNLATSGGIDVVVERVFLEDLNDLRPYWSGKITDRKMIDAASYNLVGQVQAFTGNTQGTRLREGRNCTYQLYQQFGTCMVDKEQYKQVCTIVALDGSSITVDQLANDARRKFYAGGFVEFDYLGSTASELRYTYNGDDMILDPSTYSVDPEGWVDFTVAPPNGSALKWTGIGYVPGVNAGDLPETYAAEQSIFGYGDGVSKRFHLQTPDNRETMVGIVESRGVLFQDESNDLKLVVLGGTSGMKAGMKVRVFPGCPRDWESCGTLYNNQDNYGGSPTFPGVSPFSLAIFQQ